MSKRGQEDVVPGSGGTARDTRILGRIDGYELSLIRANRAERARWEQAILDAGQPLPLVHRSAWAAFQAPQYDSWFIGVSDELGRPVGGLAVRVAPSRALPGHLLLRCERFGPGVPRAAQRAVFRGLIAFARAERRILRLQIETFAVDPDERAELESLAAEASLIRNDPARCYEHTLLVALDSEEEGIFAALHGTARRHIRAAAKHPVQLRSIEDPADFARLDDISRETFERTGGEYDPPDWSRVVELCRQLPSASRLVGLYRTDVAGPQALLAFAWGCGHGQTVQYSRAGSTRATDLRMPLMYPVVWDLIRWARQNGAAWFDFGGITRGSHDSADPLGGISDFKRYFSERTAQVGAEWWLEPRPLQARAARMITASSTLVSRVLARA